MRKSLFLIVALATFFTAFADGKYTTHTETEDGYTYEYVTNDPLKTRIYTLPNGLKAYLTVYKEEPKIQTYIAVRAGSKDDPAENTGLAHYLEHMMFKGNSQFGTKDWAAESPMLDTIEAMYNHYATLKDTAERKAYYAKIDSVSYEASKLSIANEYDKLVSHVGATGTNAYTSDDRTVYINEIPANGLEKWLRIEGTRFREITCRLFHTELEAVYEEKNRTLDSDSRQVWEKLTAMIYQKHSYGTQTSIGTIEHLKNPSITAIKKFFEEQYIPNNTAICLSGDLDFTETIQLIDKYFGTWEKKDLTEIEIPVEEDITSPLEETVYGPEEESLMFAFRLPGKNTREEKVATMMDMVLSNRAAGLIDLNVNKKQLLVGGGCGPVINNDYGMHIFYGQAKPGQSLEEVRDILLGQIELVKKGEFEDWLLEAVINDFEVEEIKKQESNRARAHSLVYAYTAHTNYEDHVSRIDDLRKITKQEIIDFANKYYGNNYAIVYKRTGERPTVKVEKPEITSVVVNREDQSPFRDSVEAMKAPALNPSFVDFDKDMTKTVLSNGVEVLYKENTENDLFKLYYVFDMGSMHDNRLGLAVKYLQYLGTKEMSAEDISIEYYKLGCSFNVSAGQDQTYVALEGLSKNMNKALAIFEDLMANPVADEEALQNLLKTTLKKRQDAMKSKGRILFGGLKNYAKYGPINPSTNVISNQELASITSKEMIEKIKGLSKYEHKVLYYGPTKSEEIVASLNEGHKMPKKFKAIPESIEFTEQATNTKKVYWVDYDMVQAEIVLLSKGATYDAKLVPQLYLFNTYFGAGMGSIVFQELRESKALAYSVNSRYLPASEAGKSNYIQAYIGTQADKLPEAMTELMNLMNNLPKSDAHFTTSQESMQNVIASDRTTKANVLFKYLKAEKLGLDHDIRKDCYDYVKDAKLSDLEAFYNAHYKDKEYVVLVVGSKDKLDFEALKQYGELEELSLKQIFGYESEEIVE